MLEFVPGACRGFSFAIGSDAFALPLAGVIAATLLLPGCGGTAPVSSDRAVDHFKVLGILYADYLASHNRTPPPDEATFLSFLEREPANWNKLAPTASEFLTSPRTGQPLRVAYGRLPQAPADGSLPWVASDSSALDGKLMMVNLRGSVRLVEETEFSQYFPER